MEKPLSEYFIGIGAKRLSDVEIVPESSNQHEFNGIAGFKEIFGNDKINFKGTFMYLADEEDAILQESGKLTWYDARERHPTRTEYRLYYSTNPAIHAAVPGDLVVIGRLSENEVAVIIAAQGSTFEHQIMWLFGLDEVGTELVIRDLKQDDVELNYAGQYIVESLGFEVVKEDKDYLDNILSVFGEKFPSTRVFSDYARSTLSSVSPVENPDTTLVAWVEREELLFRTLERHIVSKRLEQGFGAEGNDVDEFISFSLSVQNRRKSRAGLSFENHLSVIFDANSVEFSRGAKTERNNKPDFLFPRIEFYRDSHFSADLLTMLGVKTTSKDRWRQVLSEADRIEKKHLITLEPAISENQTDEMHSQNLQLVIPRPLIETYNERQQERLMGLSDFIELVKDRQLRV